MRNFSLKKALYHLPVLPVRILLVIFAGFLLLATTPITFIIWFFRSESFKNREPLSTVLNMFDIAFGGKGGDTRFHRFVGRLFVFLDINTTI